MLALILKLIQFTNNLLYIVLNGNMSAVVTIYSKPCLS